MKSLDNEEKVRARLADSGSNENNIPQRVGRVEEFGIAKSTSPLAGQAITTSRPSNREKQQIVMAMSDIPQANKVASIAPNVPSIKPHTGNSGRTPEEWGDELR